LSYARFSWVIPKGITEEFRRQLAYNKIEINENRFVGFLFIYGLFLGIGIGANASLFFEFSFIIAFLITFLAFVVIVYLILKMKSESTGKFVESVLPDALRLVASNMKSGLTTERALFVAGRPEFGALQTELKNASKRISSGEKTEFALFGISEKINSIVLGKTIWLITQGIKSGGQIANLLFQLSDDLKNQYSLEQEIKSNISMYILLILFAALFGAPLLFGVSTFIVEVLTNQLSNTPTIDLGSIQTSSKFNLIKGFATGNRELVSTEFILMFSMIMLVFTTLFSSLTIGVLNSGKETAGIRYMLPLLLGAFAVFFFSRALLAYFFGNLL